jgi:hypothetical protein
MEDTLARLGKGLNLEAIGEKSQLHALIDGLQPNEKVMVIAYRETDDMIAVRTFGNPDTKDQVYMLWAAQNRVNTNA